MGNDILPGHQYIDGQFISGPSLTDHVGEATIKPTFYSSKTAKDPVVLTDQLLIRDTVADAYRTVSLATLQGLMVGPGGVIQTSYAEYTANSNLSAVIPMTTPSRRTPRAPKFWRRRSRRSFPRAGSWSPLPASGPRA